MKTNLFKLALCSLMLLFSAANIYAGKTWTFSTTEFTATELANIKADGTTVYSQTTENTRYGYVPIITDAALTAQGTELDFTKGLKFTAKANGIRLYSKYALELMRPAVTGSGNNANASYVIIPNVPKGATITLTFKSSSGTNSVQIVSDDLTDTTSPATTGDDTYVGTATNGGDIKISYKVTVTSSMPVCQIRSISYSIGKTACNVEESSAVIYALNSTTPEGKLPTSSETSVSTATWSNSNYSFTLTGTTSSEILRDLNNNTAARQITIDENAYRPMIVNKSSGNGVYSISKTANVKSVTMYAKYNATSGTAGTLILNYGLTGQTSATTLPLLEETASSFDVTNYSNFRVSGGTAVAFKVEYYEKAELTVADIEWASLYLPFAAEIPSGAKAYYANATTASTVTLTEITDVIPANTGVVVNASEGTYDFTAAATTPDALAHTNLFEGVTVATNLTAGDNYVLAGSENSKANPLFKVYGSTGTIELAAYKAYLPKTNVPNAGNAKTINFIFEGQTTGIKTLDNFTNSPFDNDAPMFNLAGQRVGKNYKGVVIQNGKKFINK